MTVKTEATLSQRRPAEPAPIAEPVESSSVLARSLDEVRHLVVLGLPRSGTSLLMNILGEHPDVSMLDEDVHGGIYRLAGSKVRGLKICVPNQINLDRAWHPLYRLLYLNGMLRKSSLRRLRPTSSYTIRDLAKLSRVTFVCVLRDPGANLDAQKRRVRLRLEVRQAMWYQFIDTMVAMEAEPDWDQVIVSFEKLVREPEPQIQQLCERLNLPFHERMLEGPKFSWRYPKASFDAGRARGGPEDGREFPATEELGLDPAYLETYRRLLSKAI